MTADEALGASGVPIVRVYGQEAATPAMAPTALLVRWLYLRKASQLKEWKKNEDTYFKETLFFHFHHEGTHGWLGLAVSQTLVEIYRPAGACVAYPCDPMSVRIQTRFEMFTFLFEGGRSVGRASTFEFIHLFFLLLLSVGVMILFLLLPLC